MMRRSSILLALVAFSSACQTWRPAPIAPNLAAPENRPDIIRVELADGRRITMPRPVITADSIVGVVGFGSVIRTATADVRALEVQRYSLTRTFGLVLAHASAVVSVIALIVHVQPHYRGAF
jgi:hypothetical protein